MSGLRFNTGKRQWSMVDFKSLEPMIEVLEYGAHKYTLYKSSQGVELYGSQISREAKDQYEVVKSGVDNWKKGLDPKQILESMMRHIALLMDGEEIDPESGISHMGHIQCNAMFYNYMMRNNLEKEALNNVQSEAS